MCADRATLRLCRSGLVRELPGTGSKTGTHGTSEATEVACFGAASQPFADKSARPPGRSALCVRTGRRFACVGADSSANCREPAAKPVYTVHQKQPRWPVSGPLRSPSRTSPLPRPPGKSALCVRTGRRFACVGADLSANCREPAAKPVHTVHQTQPRWPVLGPLRSPSRTSPLPRPPDKSALCVRTGRRFACVGADLSANCREPAAKPVHTVHQTQPRWPVLGPLRSPSRTSPLPRPPDRSALCVRTGRRFACVGADLSANCREPAAKPVHTVHQKQPRWPVLGPLRSPSRTSPLPHPPGRSLLRAQRQPKNNRYAGFSLSSQYG